MEIARLKSSVSVLQVLEARGLGGRLRRSGRNMVGTCPVHGGDNPNAFVVNLSKNVWFCFTGCQRGGDVIDLVRCLDHVSFPCALRTLGALANEAPPPSVDLHAPPAYHHAPAAAPFRPFTRSLPLDPRAALLQAKGILPATARVFETGAYHGSGFLRACVGVRLHDLRGAPLGYAGRRLLEVDIDRYGKWKVPSKLPKREILFNYHRIRHRLRRSGVVVVECPWGVMRLHQIGIPAVALLGTSLSPTQRQLLFAASRILLMLDADSAGVAAAKRIHRDLRHVTDVRLARLPPGCDPDDLSDHHLEAAAAPLAAS